MGFLVMLVFRSHLQSGWVRVSVPVVYYVATSCLCSEHAPAQFRSIHCCGGPKFNTGPVLAKTVIQTQRSNVIRHAMSWQTCDTSDVTQRVRCDAPKSVCPVRDLPICWCTSGGEEEESPCHADFKAIKVQLSHIAVVRESARLSCLGCLSCPHSPHIA